MYQKQQPLIISSKRNTTYLMPLTTSDTTIENPFPVSHIKHNENKSFSGICNCIYFKNIIQS